MEHLPRWAGSAWAVGALAVLFLEAIVRLGGRGLTTLASGLSALEAAAMTALTLLFAYGEGYRALHRHFVPNVLARLARLPPPGQLSFTRWLLAPFYALGLAHVDGPSLRRGWASVAAIVLAIVVVRALPEPWRGIVDASVAVALSIGLLSLVGRFAMSLRAAAPQRELGDGAHLGEREG
ncbi:MAG: hypothetical protein ABW321_25405 [Polyangiales bacterium]